MNDSSGDTVLQEKGGLCLSGNKGQREEVSVTLSVKECGSLSWLLAKLEASGSSSRAQTVTCASGQIQTTMTKSGSDIIPYGLASSSDGIMKAMALDLMV